MTIHEYGVITIDAIRTVKKAVSDKGMCSNPWSGITEGGVLTGRKTHASEIAINKAWKSFVSPAESAAAADPSRLTYLKNRTATMIKIGRASCRERVEV